MTDGGSGGGGEVICRMCLIFGSGDRYIDAGAAPLSRGLSSSFLEGQILGYC